jgi:hypothetical protein
VDFAEVPAQRFDQTAGAASNFEGPPRTAVGLRRQPLELGFDIRDDVECSGQESGFILIASAEGDVIVSVFAGAFVPIGAHALADRVLGIGHLI